MPGDGPEPAASVSAARESAASWEHFSHDADMGVRGYGGTPAQAFEQAALALVSTITDPAKVRLTETVDIRRQAPSLDILLLDWLNAIIYEMAERKMVFGAFETAIENGALVGVARGEPISRERHAPAVEVKGATFTELRVSELHPGRWCAQCVIDV